MLPHTPHSTTQYNTTYRCGSGASGPTPAMTVTQPRSRYVLPSVRGCNGTPSSSTAGDDMPRYRMSMRSWWSLYIGAVTKKKHADRWRAGMDSSIHIPASGSLQSIRVARRCDSAAMPRRPLVKAPRPLLLVMRMRLGVEVLPRVFLPSNCPRLFGRLRAESGGDEAEARTHGQDFVLVVGGGVVGLQATYASSR